MKAIQLSPWQKKVAGLLQSVNKLNTIVLAGGRGGGKSILLVWIIFYYMLLYGEKFNGVLIKRTWPVCRGLRACCWSR